MLDNVKNYFHYLLVSYNFITVAIELVLIGCVVYSVMRFLRGTGGEKLFKGIVFVLLIFGVVGLFSRQFSLELDRIEWVFQSTQERDYVIKAGEGKVYIYSEQESINI